MNDLPSTTPPEQETDISILFARDPLKHTDQDIDRIIAKMREARHTFNSTPARAASSGPKLTAKEQDASKLSLKLDLGGL
jgi:hypothetical protein